MAHAHVQRHQLALGSVAPGFLGVVQHAGGGAEDLGVGLAQAALDERVVDRGTDRLVEVLARLHVVDVQVDHAARHADDHRGHGGVEHVEERHLEQVLDVTVGVLVVVADHVAAIGRHEDFLDQQLLAAGAGQADHMPVVFDLEVAALHPERAELHLPCVVDHAAAEEGAAGGVIATAGGQPLAVEQVAAVDAGDGAEGRVGGGHQTGVVLAPQLVAAARVEQADLEGMHTEHHHVPGAGRAAAGQLHQHLVQHVGVHLVAAPALGLQDLEEAGFLEGLDGLAGNHARLLAGLGLLAQPGDHRLGTGDDFGFAGDLGVDVAHGSSPLSPLHTRRVTHSCGGRLQPEKGLSSARRLPRHSRQSIR
ncbi:hypothetical protein D3C78_841800 [compost metagenome]